MHLTFQNSNKYETSVTSHTHTQYTQTHLSTQSLSRDARDEAGASCPPIAYRKPCHVATPTPPRLLAIGAQPFHLQMEVVTIRKIKQTFTVSNTEELNILHIVLRDYLMITCTRPSSEENNVCT